MINQRAFHTDLWRSCVSEVSIGHSLLRLIVNVVRISWKERKEIYGNSASVRYDRTSNFRQNRSHWPTATGSHVTIERTSTARAISQTTTQDPQLIGIDRRLKFIVINIPYTLAYPNLNFVNISTFFRSCLTSKSEKDFDAPSSVINQVLKKKIYI